MKRVRRPIEFCREVAKMAETQTLASIGKIYGVSKQAVQIWISNAGFHKRAKQKERIKNSIPKILEQVGMGVPLYRACAHFGVSCGAVTKRVGPMRDYGPHVENTKKCRKCGKKIDRKKKCLKGRRLCFECFSSWNRDRCRAYGDSIRSAMGCRKYNKRVAERVSL